MFLGALIESGEGRLKRNLCAIFLVPFHRAERQPQGEGGVGIIAGPFDGESSLRNLRVRLLLRLALRLDDLAHRAGVGVDESGQFDHGITRGVHGGPAILVKLLA